LFCPTGQTIPRHLFFTAIFKAVLKKANRPHPVPVETIHTFTTYTFHFYNIFQSTPWFMHCFFPSSFAYKYLLTGGPDSSVGIATGYGLDGPGSNLGGGEIFRTRPERSLGPPSLLYNGYRVFPVGKAAGAWCWPPTPFWRRGHKRLELYLYPPCRPVQACNGTALPFYLSTGLLYALLYPITVKVSFQPIHKINISPFAFHVCDAQTYTVCMNARNMTRNRIIMHSHFLFVP
jgi:hypothetical protein